MKWRNLVLLSLLISAESVASERLGRFYFDDLLVRPEMVVTESQGLEFDLGKSHATFLWEKDKNVSAKFRIGALELRNQSTLFNSTLNDDDFGFVEAYGQIQGLYGQIRFGLLPVEYAIEGTFSERGLLFERQFIYQQRFLSLRDLGISFFSKEDNYYTRLIIHNGESDDGPDKRVFISSTWGWDNERNLHFGLSGHTGTTKSSSTSSSTGTFAGVDNSKEAKWRLATLFAHWYPNKWHIGLEAHSAELEQEKVTTQFASGYFDFGYRFTKQWALYARYEQWDPNKDVENDGLQAYQLSLILSDRNETSKVFLNIRSVEEESTQVANDEYRLIWQLNSLY